jgi:hypothetical protein
MESLREQFEKINQQNDALEQDLKTALRESSNKSHLMSGIVIIVSLTKIWSDLFFYD